MLHTTILQRHHVCISLLKFLICSVYVSDLQTTEETETFVKMPEPEPEVKPETQETQKSNKNK